MVGLRGPCASALMATFVSDVDTACAVLAAPTSKAEAVHGGGCPASHGIDALAAAFSLSLGVELDGLVARALVAEVVPVCFCAV